MLGLLRGKMPNPNKLLDKDSASYLMQTLQTQMGQANTPVETDLFAWTQRYRVLGGQPVHLPPCQIPIYEDFAPEVVIMKGTQIFISEYLINLALWCLDTRFGGRGNVLYTMPTQQISDDFSQSRVDKAIAESPYLSKRFKSQDKTGKHQKDTYRARLKMIGHSALHLRGSDSIKQLTTIDADIVIDDEVDFFTQEIIRWSKERLGSAEQPLFRAVSKPTYPGYGIHLLYQDSDQREWHIKCEHCNHWQNLVWEKNIVFALEHGVVKDVKVLCAKIECRKELNRFAEGEWVAAYPGRPVHGYHISRLLSPYVNLVSLAEDSLKVTDIPVYQSFYNSGLGLPYAPKGGKLEETELVMDTELELQPATTRGYGGVDVGIKLHCAVIEKIDGGKVLRQADEFDTFEELDNWFLKNNIKTCVIDARGDPRATLDWANKYPGRVHRWNHIETAEDTRYNDETAEVKVNRTTLLDRMYASCREGAIRFPSTIKNVPDFIPHLKALVRELIKDQRLNKLVPRYIGAAPDHYAFALAFANLAAGDDIVTPAPTAISKEPYANQPRTRGASWTGHTGSRGWRHVG